MASKEFKIGCPISIIGIILAIVSFLFGISYGLEAGGQGWSYFFFFLMFIGLILIVIGIMIWRAKH
jgi:uncharacterized membrane protein